MRKNDTFHSFHDLDASRFRKADAPLHKKQTVVAETSIFSDAEDESTMFLAAAMGSMDVSLKYTPVTPNKPVSRVMKIVKEQNLDAVPPEKTPAEPPLPPKSDENALFARAMEDVHPITTRGRDLAPATQNLQPAYNKALTDMDDIFSGKFEFSLEYTEEFVQGNVYGLDPLVLEKLKAGAYSPEAHVDLHGQNMEQAYTTLAQFVRNAYQNGKRHLIVVTGRGKNSPGGVPVLRERVQTWFTRDPFKRVVLGFCSAKPGDGGAGALYLLLRKRKKSHGKIVWNNTPSEEELLL